MGFTPGISPTTLVAQGEGHENVLRHWSNRRGAILERQLLGGLGNAVGGAVGGTVSGAKDLTSGLGLPCLIPGVAGNCAAAAPALSSPVVIAPTSPRPATTPATTRPAATRPPVTAPSSPATSPSSPNPATSAPATPNNPSPNPSPTTAAPSSGPVASSSANGGSPPGTAPLPTRESQVVLTEPATTFVLSTVINGETVAFSTATLTGTSAIAVASSLLATDAVITTTDAGGQTLTLSGTAVSVILASSLSSLLSEATATSVGFVTTTDSRGRITTSFRSARPTSTGGATTVAEVQAAAAADRTRSVLIGVLVSVFVVGIALAVFFLWGRRRRTKTAAALSPGSSIHSQARFFPQNARLRPTFLGLPVSFHPSKNRNVAASIQSRASSTYGTSIISTDSVESQFEIRSYHRDGPPYEGNSTPPSRTDLQQAGSLVSSTPATFVPWQRQSSTSSSGEVTVRQVGPVWPSASAPQHSEVDLPYASRRLGASTTELLSAHREESQMARSLQPPFHTIFPSRPRPTPPPRSLLRPPFTLVPIPIEEDDPRTSCDTRSQRSFETAASRLGTASQGSDAGDSEEEETKPAHEATPRLRLNELAQTGEDPFAERVQRRWQASASGYRHPQEGRTSGGQDQMSGPGFVQRHPVIKPRVEWVPPSQERKESIASSDSGLGSILREFPAGR